jgi:hypothetical protein
MMKKIYLIVMLTLLSFSAWCQRSSTEFEAKKSFEHNIERTEKMTSALLQMKEEQKINNNNRAATFPLWVSFYDALIESGIDGEISYPFIFPDTLPIIAVETTDPFQMSLSASGFAYAAAQTFHPSSIIYAEGYEDDAAFGTNSIFQVDSARFYYAYTRNTAPIEASIIEIIDTTNDTTITTYDTVPASQIIDTLRVHIITSNFDMYRINGNTDEDPSIVFIPVNTPGHAPTNASQTFDILLDSSKATPEQALSVETVGLDILLNKDEKFTLAIEYIPGSTYSLGDTLIAAEGVTPSTAINYFQLVTIDEEEAGEMVSQSLGGTRNWNFASIRNPYFHESWDDVYVSAPVYATSTFFTIEQLLTEYYVSEATFPDFVISKDGRTVTVANNSSFQSGGATTWDFGDESGNLKIGETVEYEYTIGGASAYDITMTTKNQDNVSFSITKKVIVDWNTGMDELVEDMSLSTFPNPANNQLAVNVNLRNAGVVTLQITDLYGRTVYTETRNDGAFMKTIDVSNFAAAGNYSTWW